MREQLIQELMLISEEEKNISQGREKLKNSYMPKSRSVRSTGNCC